MQYKKSKKPIKQIAEELNVVTILEGSVRHSGNQVRIVAQLIDAADDAHLWSETYDRELKQIFAIQSDVAQKIAAALQTRLSHAERSRIERQPTTSTEAYNLYQKGRYYWNRRSAGTMPIALKFFEQAVALDSQYALAWTGIADCYSTGKRPYLNITAHEALKKAYSAAKQALAYDPLLAEAHASLAAVEMGLWQWEAAGQSFQRSIELNPGYATAHHWYGEFLLTSGRTEAAIAELKKGIDLDPLSVIIQSTLGWAYLAARDIEKALSTARAILATEADFADALDCEAQALLLANVSEAESFPVQLKRDSLNIPLDAAECMALREAFRKRNMAGFWEERATVLRQRAQRKLPVWDGFFIESYAQLGNASHALEYLQRLYDAREPSLIYLRVWTYVDPLRSDARFQEIVRRINFPSEPVSGM